VVSIERSVRFPFERLVILKQDSSPQVEARGWFGKLDVYIVTRSGIRFLQQQRQIVKELLYCIDEVMHEHPNLRIKLTSERKREDGDTQGRNAIIHMLETDQLQLLQNNLHKSNERIHGIGSVMTYWYVCLMEH